MGMFDEFIPDPAIACPECGALWDRFQGKDGPNLLLVWKQGYARPVGHDVDADVRFDADRLGEFSLPERFVILGSGCAHSAKYGVLCECVAGGWATSTVISRDDVRSFYDADWRT